MPTSGSESRENSTCWNAEANLTGASRRFGEASSGFCLTAHSRAG